MLFYSIELLLVHITCLHIYFVYIYLHLLAQDARLCHGRGKDHRILWTIVNASGRLRLHGFGGLRCACRREASRSPPPPKYPSMDLCGRFRPVGPPRSSCDAYVGRVCHCHCGGDRRSRHPVRLVWVNGSFGCRTIAARTRDLILDTIHGLQAFTASYLFNCGIWAA